MKVLLIYPPFCSPVCAPYSITRIHAFLKNNAGKDHTISSLDLNIMFHKQRFPDYAAYTKSLNTNYNKEEYDKKTSDYKKESSNVYKESNRNVIVNKQPELFNELLQQILKQKPDIAAFSIVYSSQVFYTLTLIAELKKQGIKCIVGGPAVNTKLKEAADENLANELELLEFIKGKEVPHNTLHFETILDFSIFPLKDYFTPEPVIPLRTSSSCYYRRCAFCTHHGHGHYFEYPVEELKHTLEKSKAKKVFLTDDMIHKKRLLELATIFAELDIEWMCQIRPTNDMDKDTLTTLKKSGLKVLIWGVESASDRILNLMSKGTNNADIKTVLEDSKKAGIKNLVYIMFGFPSETKEEFMETIEFLKQNQDNIDLVSTSIFGLQKGTPIYNNPNKFGISRINETKRTLLEDSITYEVAEGLSNKEAKELRKRNLSKIDKLCSYPRSMNTFKEHLLCI